MPIWQRTYVAACAAMIGFGLAYTMSDFGRWPRLFYFPYERQWHVLSTPPGPVPMGYVGTLLWGVGGAVVAGVVVWFGSKLVHSAVSDRVLHLAGGWALATGVYASAYYFWNLWPL